MPTYEECKEKITNLSDKIEDYNVHVNESGIWLFLAVLGCWGVDDINLRYGAVIASFCIFSHKFWSGIKGFTPFCYQIKLIEREIDNSDMAEKDKESLKFRMVGAKKELGIMRIAGRVPAYYISGVFLLFSLYKWPFFGL